MPTPYKTLAASSGEMRLYVASSARLIVEETRSALGYAFAHEREHRILTDPWESAFGDARRIASELMFTAERDRVIQALNAQAAGPWDADLLYYPPGQGGALYSWSTAEEPLK